ncbi:MAG: 6-carboxytetrahydropterin synthase [Gemmatimonadales bacterium]
MSVTLTRTVRFTARHRYFRPEWPEAKNRSAFGACTEPPGHAHDYRCAATVSGPVDPETGMIVDLALLDRILEEEVVLPLHGKHFNLDLPAFAYGQSIPTGEAVAEYLFRRIAARLPAPVRLERVRVQEDEALYAECNGI